MLNVHQNQSSNPVIEFELIQRKDKEDWFDTVVTPPHIQVAKLVYEEYTGLDNWHTLYFDEKMYWFKEANPLLK